MVYLINFWLFFSLCSVCVLSVSVSYFVADEDIVLKRSVVLCPCPVFLLLNTSSFVSFRLNFSLAVIRSQSLADISQQFTACCLFKNCTLTHGVPFRGTLLPITVLRLTTRAWGHVHSRTLSVPFVIEAENYSSYHSYHIIKFNEWRTTTQTPNAFWLNWQISQLAIFFYAYLIHFRAGVKWVFLGVGGMGVSVWGCVLRKIPRGAFSIHLCSLSIHSK